MAGGANSEALIAALTAMLAQTPLPPFGWGASVGLTQATLGIHAPAPHPCSKDQPVDYAGCQALVIGKHRLGRYDYRLEFQHHPTAGLHRIVVEPRHTWGQERERATAYALLAFDAAFSEAHGRLVSSPTFRHVGDLHGKGIAGQEWTSLYGLPSGKIRLHSRIKGGYPGEGHLVIEALHVRLGGKPGDSPGK